MSAATAEPEVSTPPERRISESIDEATLRRMKVDMKEAALIAEYFEYRDTRIDKPGPLPEATLIELAVRQKRRLAKKPKGQ